MIKEADVLDALYSMENELFNGRTQESNPNMPIVLRIMSVFSEVYYKNYYPEESKILIESYTLLQNKGYYYDTKE